MAWARIRLIKLRIRAASRKWNYRGVDDDGGGECAGFGDSQSPYRVGGAVTPPMRLQRRYLGVEQHNSLRLVSAGEDGEQAM